MIKCSNLQMYLNFSTVYRLHLRPPSKHDKANDRRRRTNVIIIAVTAIFFFGWMPLNILNVATEFDSAGILRSFLGCGIFYVNLVMDFWHFLLISLLFIHSTESAKFLYTVS